MSSIWKSNIRHLIKDISDIEYQKIAWFGLDKDIVDSPGEMYCALFDDLNFEIFLERSDEDISDCQRKQGYKLIEKMNSIDELYIDNVNLDDFINSKEWEDVRKEAKLFLDCLSCPTVVVLPKQPKPHPKKDKS